MGNVQWFMVLDATCPGFQSFPCDFGQPTDSDRLLSFQNSFIMKACRPLYDYSLNARLPRIFDVLVLGPVVGEPELRVLSLRRGFDVDGDRGGKSMGASLFIKGPIDSPIQINGEDAYRLLKAGLDHIHSFRGANGRLVISASRLACSFAPAQGLVQAVNGMALSSEPMRTAPPIAIVDASVSVGITTIPNLMGRFIEQELGTARGKSLLFSDYSAFVQAVEGDKEIYDPRKYAFAKAEPKASVAAQGEERPIPSPKPQAGAMPSDEEGLEHQFGLAGKALLDAVVQVATVNPAFRETAISRLMKLAMDGKKATL